jgi:hypothetical protein
MIYHDSDFFAERIEEVLDPQFIGESLMDTEICRSEAGFVGRGDSLLLQCQGVRKARIRQIERPRNASNSAFPSAAIQAFSLVKA